MTGEPLDERRRRDRARARRRRVDRTSRRRTRSSCAAPGRSAGRPPRRGATRGLRRLRQLRVRLPARDQAVRDPGPSRRRLRGRRPDRAGRAGHARPARGRRAVGVEADASAEPATRPARARRPAPERRPRRRARSGRRRSSGDPGSTIRAIGRHLRLHPVPVVAGRFDEPVEMWRGTMQAARRSSSSSREPGRNGYVIESAPGHPGPPRARPAVGGHEAHAGVMAGVRRIWRR